MSGGSDAELSSNGKKGRFLGPVVGAFGEMSDGVYVIADAVLVLALFLSRIYWPWGLVAHRGWRPLVPRLLSSRFHFELRSNGYNAHIDQYVSS